MRCARTPPTARDCSCLNCALLTAFLLKHRVFIQRQAQGLPRQPLPWCASHATLSLSTSFCRRVGEPPREIYAEVVPGDALPTLTRCPGRVYHDLARFLALLIESARSPVWQADRLDSIARAVSMAVAPAMACSNRTETDVSRAAGSCSRFDVDRARCSCLCACLRAFAQRRGQPLL